MLLGVCLLLAGCGDGSEGQPAPEVPRMDFSVSLGGCTPSCPLSSYSIFLVRTAGVPCVLYETAGPPGQEAVLAGVKLEEGAAIMITLLAYCAGDPCVKCTALRDTVIRDGGTATLEMMTMPGCFKAPVPPRCR